MTQRRPLILDLDFTLIFLEWVPDAIEVPGRTRSAWLAPSTVAALREMRDKFEIILATARSWEGAHWVAEGLEARGVEIGGVVIEDGASWGGIGALRAFDAGFDAVKLRAQLESLRQNAADWPDFEWQLDFHHCAVARCENTESAAELGWVFGREAEIVPWNARFFRDGRKVYLLPRAANKWSALEHLLGSRAPLAAGVGDGDNDLVWLSQIANPATFGDAKLAVVETVRARGGMVGNAGDHAAVAEILRELAR